jgi:hypothetical protein
VGEVEKVVDEPAQMGDLMADRGSRPQRDVVLLKSATSAMPVGGQTGDALA